MTPILFIKIKGLTLLELLITMGLCVSLTLIGITSYSYLVQKNEQQTILDDLQTAIQYAKIQTIILGRSVTLSPLDESLNWSKGMVLTRLNRKLNKKELIYQWKWHHPLWSLNWAGVNSTDKIFFSSDPARAISNGRFILMNNSSQKQVTLILNRLGRIKMSE